MTLLAVLALLVPAQPPQRADTATAKDSAAIRAAAVAFVTPKDKSTVTGPILITADTARTLVFYRGGAVAESVRVERRAGKWVAVRIDGVAIH